MHVLCAALFLSALPARSLGALAVQEYSGGRCSPDIEHEIKEEKGRTVKNRAAVLLS